LSIGVNATTLIGAGGSVAREVNFSLSPAAAAALGGSPPTGTLAPSPPAPKGHRSGHLLLRAPPDGLGAHLDRTSGISHADFFRPLSARTEHRLAAAYGYTVTYDLSLL
jgi:hypothetical protein